MATTTKTLYPGRTAITITLNSLSNSSTVGRASTVVDNTANLYLDALVSLTIQASGSVGTNPIVSVFAYAVGDNSNYTDGVTGADASYTLLTTPNLRLMDVINVNNTTAFTSAPKSVANAFGGVLPPKWGIVVVNNSGVALAAAAQTASYEPIQVQNI